ncbi:hypothetical protein F1C58_03895 [Glaciihabitans sp. INWT7]|uniref:hypothetical protein n=1 Tax=Glaciihabitans sp. INWT7 TaxID=2596912 RepID=UPI00162A1B30|nr:hypothetical protein [Glaciihabitans sp. INWT7]QNE46136.1 hypothetical protein F1C58_03895 [Glaciihabitans sp. INWT7]
MSEFTPRALEAIAYRDGGKWWTIEIPELDTPGPEGKTNRAIGGAVSLRELETAARDLAAVWLDVDVNDVAVTVRIVIPAEVQKLWDDGSAAEITARESVQQAALLRRDAVRALRNDGYTFDAAAAALGVSRQRVQQLANIDPAALAKERTNV